MSITVTAANTPAGVTQPTSAVAPVKDKQAGQSTSKSTSAQSKQDTVKLSGSVLAKFLEQSGQSPEQIAEAMGLPIATVDSYLGIEPQAAVAPSAPQVKTTVP